MCVYLPTSRLSACHVVRKSENKQILHISSMFVRKCARNMPFTYLLVNCLADNTLLLAAYQAKFEQRLCLCSGNDKITSLHIDIYGIYFLWIEEKQPQAINIIEAEAAAAGNSNLAGFKFQRAALAFFNYKILYSAALIAAVYVKSYALAYQQCTYICINNAPTIHTCTRAQCGCIDFIIWPLNAAFETLKHSLRRNAQRLAGV